MVNYYLLQWVRALLLSILEKDIKSWLARPKIWQVHTPLPREIHHLYYDVIKPNEQHQFDLVHMPHNFFEGNMYRYLLTGVDVASRYGVAKPLTTKKTIEVVFVLKAIYKKDGTFKYPKVLQIDNGSVFKGEVTKLFEKQSVKIRRATTKYKHTHTAPVEAFNKELEKLLFKPMDAQELQNPKNVCKTWVKNVNPAVKRLNNTVSSVIGMKPKDAIKLDTVPPDKKYTEETVLPEDGLYRYLYQPGEQIRVKKIRVD